MALQDLFNFNDFRDTIFKKEDSNLQQEIDRLKKLRNDSNKNKIDYDIKLLEIGLQGEKQIEYELRNTNIGMYVLHDVTFEYDGQKAQIDYIIITKAYTYFVECKNLIGNVYVNKAGEFRREYTINGKTYKEAIYSPYTQAVRHRDMYEKLWKSQNTSIIDKTLRKDVISTWIKPLVVLANSNGMLKIEYAPKEIKEHTIRVDNLVNYIKKDIKSVDKDYYISQKDMEAQADRWMARNIEGSTYISDRYKNTATYQKQETQKQEANATLIEAKELKEKLEQFRKEKSRKMNIPAYYVFTNEELEEIIKKKPVTLVELRDILPSIKVKVHGEEIINIIKNIV